MSDTIQLPSYLEITSEFIPFSISRNADEKHRTLNWSIALSVSGRKVLSVPYSAGCAHCPSYKQFVAKSERYNQRLLIEAETETGYVHRWDTVSDQPIKTNQKIKPSSTDVLSSLLLDSETIHYSDLEDWASDYGYSSDSREAERIYKASLEIAVKLDAALGSERLEELKELFEDY